MIEDLILNDVEHENKMLTVGDNLDPYENKVVFIDTHGACGLTLEQVDELIAKLFEITRKYDK